MGQVIEAPGKVLSKAEAEALGIVCTGDSITLSSDSLAIHSDPEPVVKEDTEEKKIELGKPAKKTAKKK